MQNTKDNDLTLNDDIRFLIACCQTKPSEEDIKQINNYIQNSAFNLQHLLILSNQHGILPLVYKTIKKLNTSSHLELNSDTLVVKTKEGCSDNSLSSLNAARSGNALGVQHLTLNAEILPKLKAHYMSISQRNILMSAELIRIMKLLRENHIEALAFKGSALSQMAYGDITLRQYGDLDILVDEEEAYKAAELLQSHGFTAPYPLCILKNKTCMRVDSDFALVGNTNNILIEMHWRLFRKNIGHHLTFDQFSKDPKTVKINGVPIKTLSPELHLLYLSLHGSKHAWERIEWIVDIDKFIRNNTLDEQLLKETFQILKADRPILVGLLLAHRLFQTPLQTWIIEKINKDHEIEALYITTVELLNKGFHTMTEIERSRTIYLYQRRFFKSRAKKIKYFLETYLSISSNDCKEFPLPTSLRFLYLFIKPVRILFKYLRYKK